MENPKIRFKGFTKDWEQRKFGDLADYKKGPFGSALKKDIFVPKSDTTVKVYEQQNAINKDWHLERYFITEEYANKLSGFKVEGGDIIVSCAGTIGETYEIPMDAEPGIINQALMKIKVKESIVNKKMFNILFTNMIDDFTRVHSNGSAIKNIPPFSDLKPMEVFVPEMDEQNKISFYFSNLDYLITLHQRKCEQTKNLKKYMLQKMFPQNGAKVPEIRFDGFTYDWEQRKFCDVAVRASSVSTSSSDIPSVEYEDVVAEEGRLNKDIRLKEAVKSGIIFDGSQVLYGKLRPYLHNWLNPDFNGIAVGDWWVLKPINMDKNFLYRLIQTQQFDNIANQSSGSKMPRADWNLISNSEFMVPFSKEEQCKIGGYFDNLDHLITLHQRQTDFYKKTSFYFISS